MVRCGRWPIFLDPEVGISSVKSSDKEWRVYRAGFDEPIDQQQADGTPGEKERGIVYSPSR